MSLALVLNFNIFSYSFIVNIGTYKQLWAMSLLLIVVSALLVLEGEGGGRAHALTTLSN